MSLIVQQSGINGWGVYTDAPIKKGDLVLAWNPKGPLTKAELDALPDYEHRYLETMQDGTYLMQPPERFVNHSCNANTNPVGASDIAIRDIMTGEEITSDYRFSNSDQDFECRCGAPNCGGRIITIKHP